MKKRILKILILAGFVFSSSSALAFTYTGNSPQFVAGAGGDSSTGNPSTIRCSNSIETAECNAVLGQLSVGQTLYITGDISGTYTIAEKFFGGGRWQIYTVESMSYNLNANGYPDVQFTNEVPLPPPTPSLSYETSQETVVDSMSTLGYYTLIILGGIVSIIVGLLVFKYGMRVFKDSSLNYGGFYFRSLPIKGWHRFRSAKWNMENKPWEKKLR